MEKERTGAWEDGDESQDVHLALSVLEVRSDRVDRDYTHPLTTLPRVGPHTPPMLIHTQNTPPSLSLFLSLSCATPRFEPEDGRGLTSTLTVENVFLNTSTPMERDPPQP